MLNRNKIQFSIVCIEELIENHLTQENMSNLSSTILSWWVLCSEQHELGVGLDRLLRLGYKQFSIVIQELKHTTLISEMRQKTAQLNSITFSISIQTFMLGLLFYSLQQRQQKNNIL